MSSFGYVIDLSGVTLNDNGVTWLQAMPIGKYKHPRFGEIDITPERATRFATNVKAGVRDTELDIDYDHKEKTTEAAGWVKDAEVRLGGTDLRQNGLWIAVDFNDDAKAAIKAKKYRYFSPEFSDTWTHPKTNVTHKDVLFGGALTNRPFLKDIMPINLSDFAGGYMLEEMRKLLGLPDDADEATVVAKATEKLTPPTADPKPDPQPTPTVTEPIAATEPKVETEPKDDPAVKAMSDRIATLETALRLSEVNNKVKELNDGAKLGITPALADKIKELALEAPASLTDKVFAMAKELTEGKGLVDLSEQGRTTSSPADGVTKRFTDAVEKYKTDNKCDYVDASEAVAASDPDLFEAYRRESFVRETS